jgi:hypothetical protein
MASLISSMKSRHLLYEESVRSYLQESRAKLLMLSNAPPIFREKHDQSFLAVILEHPHSYFKRIIEEGLKSSCEGTNTGKNLAVYTHKTILSIPNEEEGTASTIPIEVRFINTVELSNELIRGNPVWIGLILSLQLTSTGSSCRDSTTTTTKGEMYHHHKEDVFSPYIYVDDAAMKELISSSTFSVGLSSHIHIHMDDTNFFECSLSLVNGLLKKLAAKQRGKSKQSSKNKPPFYYIRCF